MQRVNYDVNINEYPTPQNIASHPEGSAATVGDLHGNAIKFLQLLVCEGVIDISPENYKKMVECYYNHGQKADNNFFLNQFKNCLSQIKLKKPSVFLRLIGDDLADRGLNDHLTLELFDCLKKLNAPFEVILSNHGFEFLKQFAKGLKSDELVLLYQGGDSSFGNSYYGLRNDLEKGLVSENDINKLMFESYLPNLKFLSYHITDDSNITIYSHAPIDPYKIQSLATLFDIEFRNGTVKELGETIDKINAEFARHMGNLTLMRSFMEMLKNNPEKFSILDNFINDRYDAVNALDSKMNYKVQNIHGHVGERDVLAVAPPGWTYVNLDTDLGKTPKLSKHNYLAFIKAERVGLSLENKRDLLYHDIKNQIATSLNLDNTQGTQSPMNRKLENLLENLSGNSFNKGEAGVDLLNNLTEQLEKELSALKNKHTGSGMTLFSVFSAKPFEESICGAKVGTEQQYSRLLVQLLSNIYRSELVFQPTDKSAIERNKACRSVVERVETLDPKPIMTPSQEISAR